MPNTRAGDAFITMLAGYQVYKSKSFSGSSILIGKEKTAQARSASLIASYYIYKDKDKKTKPVKNMYVGNRTFYKYVDDRDLDIVSDLVHRNVRTTFRGKKYKGDKILQNFFPDLTNRLKQDGDKIAIGSAAISTPSERLEALGDKQLMMNNSTERGKMESADPVDVMHKGRGYQVTFSPLTAADHHGLYGAGHKAMMDDFAKYKNQNLKEDELDNKRAKRALSYFRDRLTVFNRAMKQMQKIPLTKTMTGQDTSRLRQSILQAGGGRMKTYKGFQVENRRGFNKMAGNVTGFFNKSAASFVRTALGKKNFGADTAGVTYTFPLSKSPADAYKFVHLSNFQLHTRMGFIQFNKRALRSAKVVEGHDSLSAQLAADLHGHTEYSVASRMFNAQVASEAKVIGDTTEVMKMTATEAAGAKAKTRWYPSIDLVHADKQLSHFLRNQGTEMVERWFKSYTSTGDTKFSKALGQRRNFDVKGEQFWALPYISFADYDIRRFEE